MQLKIIDTFLFLQIFSHFYGLFLLLHICQWWNCRQKRFSIVFNSSSKKSFYSPSNDFLLLNFRFILSLSAIKSNRFDLYNKFLLASRFEMCFFSSLVLINMIKRWPIVWPRNMFHVKNKNHSFLHHSQISLKILKKKKFFIDTLERFIGFHIRFGIIRFFFCISPKQFCYVVNCVL